MEVKETTVAANANNTETALGRSRQRTPLPDWVTYGRQNALELWGEPLELPEWQHYKDDDKNNNNNDEEDDKNNNNKIKHVSGGVNHYRLQHGFQGRDLLHSIDSPVRILQYHVRYGDGSGLPSSSSLSSWSSLSGGDSMIPHIRGGIGTTLTGLVHFTCNAESHGGLCHGGGFCSVIDDVMAWCAMVVTGTCIPWSGFTVQLSTTLSRSIPVDSILLAQAWVTRLKGPRKVYVQARLINPKYISTLRSLSSNIPTNAASTTSNNYKMIKSEDDHHHGAIVHAVGEGLIILKKGVLQEVTTTTTTKSLAPETAKSRVEMVPKIPSPKERIRSRL